MKSILDKSFRYTSSVETDLRKTFARVRRELREKQIDAEKIVPLAPRLSGLTPGGTCRERVDIKRKEPKP